MTASTLSAGDIALIGYNTSSSDGFTFVLLKPIGSDTSIKFTDRTWNGTAFVDSGADSTLTFTATTDMAAGTVISSTDPAYSALFTGTFLDLDSNGDTIFAYQGADATPTFLHGVGVADANALTQNGGTLSGTGLTLGTTAVAVADNNAVYGDRDHNIQIPQLLQLIGDAGNWAQDEVATQVPITGSFFSAPDQQVWVAMAGGSGIARIERDGADVGTNQIIAFQGSTDPATQLNHPNEIVFDTVHGLFFIADSDTGNRRIMQGNISDLYTPGVIPTLTVLYTDQSAGTGGGQINGLAIDVDHATGQGALYFVNQTNFNRIVYDHDGTSPTNQAPVTLANLGASQFANEIALDIASNRAWVMSTASSTEPIEVPEGTPGALFDEDGGVWYIIGTAVTNNQIYQIDGLDRTDTAIGQNTVTSLSFSGAFDDPDIGGTNDFNDHKGLLQGIDIDPVGNFLYFTTVQLNNGVGGSTGGIFRHDLANGTTEELYTEGPATDYGFKYIDVDPASGRYYVSNISFESPGDPNGTSVNTSSIMTHALGSGTPTEFMQIGADENSAAPWGLTVQNAPTLTSTFAVTQTTTEEDSPNSGNSIFVTLSTSHVAADPDTSGQVDQLAGAQVRISTNFLSGGEHQDLLTVDGDADGTGTLVSGIQFSYSQSTGVLTFTGPATFDEYETALSLVQFATNGDNPTNYGAAETRTLAFSVFDGLMYSDEQTTTVNAVGTNDAPVNDAVPDTTPSGAEDSGAIAVVGLGVFDVDADPDSQEIELVLSVPAGTGTIALNLAVSGGVTAASVTGGAGAASDVTSMTITATQAQINATLADAGGLTFTPAADVNGTVALTMTTSDLGLNGTGGALTDTDTVDITVTAVNDAPTISGDGTEEAAVIFEDQPSVVGETVSSLFAGHFSDALDDQAATSGTSANDFAGIAVVSDGTTGSGSWEWFDTGTSAWIAIDENSAADALLLASGTAIRFNPAQDFNGTAPSLTAHLVDDSEGALTSGATADLSAPGGTSRYSSDTVELGQSVTPVNDAPTAVDLDGDDVTWLEGGGPVAVDFDTNAAIEDIDSTNFDGGSLTVSITSGLVSAEDELGIDTSGTVSVNGAAVFVGGVEIGTVSTGGTGGDDLQFSFDEDATPAAVQALIRALTFSNTGGDTPTEGVRGITVTLVDGDGTDNSGADTLIVSTTVTVTGVNDAPSGGDNSATIDEDATHIFTAADFSTGFSDIEGDEFAGLVITTLPSLGTLYYDADGIGGDPAEEVSGGDSFTLADLTGGKLIYVPGQDGNGTPYTTFTFQVRDDGGTDNGGEDLDPGAATFTFNVTAVNDAPSLDGLDNAPAWSEGGGAVLLDDTLTVVDPDDVEIVSATVTITDFLAGDLLDADAGTTDIQVSYADGVLSLTGAASLADYEAVLKTVAYDSSSDNPTDYGAAVTRTISWVLDDGTDETAPAPTTTLALTAENDAPTLDLDGSASGSDYAAGVYLPLAAGLAIADTDATIVDPDDTEIEQATITITNHKAGDQLTIDGTLPNGITASSYDDGTGVLTLSGSASLADYQAALAQVLFSNTEAVPNPETRTITVTVNDGDADSNVATATVVLNEPPVAVDDEGAADEDDTTIVSAGDGVLANDSDPEGEEITVVAVEGVEANVGQQVVGTYGTLTLAADGSYTYSADQAAADGLAAGATDTDTFAYSVSDGVSTSTADLVITVTGVNDAPSLTAAAPTLASITEDDTNGAGQTVASILATSVADPDAGAVGGIALTGLTSGNGSWQYSLDGTTWSDVGTVSATSALLLEADDSLRFVPNGETGTSASITYRAWDQTTGTAGSKVDPGAGGGTTAFSTASDTATLTVTDVNDAPVLTDAAVVLAGETEDAGAPVNGTAVGTLVSSLIDANPPAGGLNNVADVDGPSTGIAVTAVDTTIGTWWFSTDGGATWQSLGTPSESIARLLSADADTRIYLEPAANLSGETAQALTFRAWDGSVGVNGATADASSGGGTSAFSSATDTASITITPAGDVTIAADDVNGTETDGAVTVLLDLTPTIGDTDGSETLTGVVITFTGAPAGLSVALGTLTDNGGGSYTLALAAADVAAASITVPANYYGSFDGSAVASSNEGDSTADTFTVTISPTNDAPDLRPNATGDATYEENGAPAALFSGVTLAPDVDRPDDYSGGSLSIAITGGMVVGDRIVLRAGSGFTLDGDGTTLRNGNGDAVGTVTGLGTGSVAVSGLTAFVTPASADALIRAFGFVSDGEALMETPRSVTLTFSDGGNVGGSELSDTLVQTVQVSAVNDAPVLDLDGSEPGTGYAATFTEDGPAVAVADIDLSISDVDSATIAGATITIANVKPDDELLLTGPLPAGITSSAYDPATGVLTLSGTASPEAYEAALLLVSFRNTSDTPDTAGRQIEITVNDGELDSAVATATITVVGVPDPKVAVSDTTVVEGDDGTVEAVFTVTRSGDLTPFSVNFSTADGSALAGEDYLASSGTLFFGDGETAKTISVIVLGDTKMEADETFLLNLSGPTGGAVLTDAQGVATIKTDDSNPSRLAISPSNVAHIEGDDDSVTFLFTVTRGGNTARSASAEWKISGATEATSSDFASDQALSGTVSFAAGETVKTIAIRVAGDTDVEPDEHFAVTLSDPSAGTVITQAQAIGTIISDDTTLAIEATDAEKAEGDAGATNFIFTVTRVGATEGELTATYAVGGALPGDFGGTRPTGEITFAAGEAEKQIVIEVTGDTVAEADQPFTLTLTDADDNVLAIGHGTIENDDPAFFDAAFAGPILRLYQAVLGRLPDPEGLAFWIDQFANGRPLIDLAGDFVDSDEFRDQHGDVTDGSDPDFIATLYTNVLGRDPDPDGLDFWTGLDDPDPAAIVLLFSQSDEYIARTGPAIEDFLAEAEAGTQDYRGHLLDTNDDGVIDEQDAGFPSPIDAFADTLL